MLNSLDLRSSPSYQKNLYNLAASYGLKSVGKTSSIYRTSLRKKEDNYPGETYQEQQAYKMIEYAKIVEEHNKVRKELLLEKEMEECTFAPKINERASQKPKRSINEFLEDQKNYVQKVEEKKKKLQDEAKQKELANIGPHKPELSEGTRKILEKKKEEKQGKNEPEEPVHDRLYQLGRNSQIKNTSVAANETGEGLSRNSSNFIGRTPQDIHPEATFRPQISEKSKNLKREGRIEDHLYQDAIRRHRDSVTSASAKPKPAKPKISESTQKALAMRFIKEFDLAILDYLHEGESKLDYLRLNEFLRKLCFLRESERIESPHFTPERLLLFDLWYMLQGDKRKGIHRRNLLVFCLAILGLQFQITKIEKGEESQQSVHESEMELSNQFSIPESYLKDKKLIGTFDEDGNYELTPEEVNKIHKMFDLWHINRISSHDNFAKAVAANKKVYEEPTFHPEISESSKNLALQKRGKILEDVSKLIEQNKINVPKDGKIAHVDLLILSKEFVKEKIEKLEAQYKEKEYADCTFKPQILEYQTEHTVNTDRSSRITPTVSLGKDRVYELYSLAKPRSERKDRTTNEIEYEKSCDECTFQPNISSSRHNKSVSSEKSVYAKNIEETIERLRSARSEREHIMSQLERGFGNNSGNPGYFIFAINHGPKAKASIEYHTRGPGSAKKLGSGKKSYRGMYLLRNI